MTGVISSVARLAQPQNIVWAGIILMVGINSTCGTAVLTLRRLHNLAGFYSIIEKAVSAGGSRVPGSPSSRGTLLCLPIL